MEHRSQIVPCSQTCPALIVWTVASCKIRKKYYIVSNFFDFLLCMNRYVIYCLLVGFLLTSCSYAPDGSSRTPYTPHFEAFLGDGETLIQEPYRCNLDILELKTVDLRGKNFLPTISWRDAPVTPQRSVKSYFIGMFSNENHSQGWCSATSDFPCTHFIFSVRATDANYGGLTSNTGGVQNDYIESREYAFSGNAWSANSTKYKDRTHIGSCKVDQQVKYRVVVIASSMSRGDLAPGTSDNYVTYEHFVNTSGTGAIGDEIMGIAEIDLTYKLQ